MKVSRVLASVVVVAGGCVSSALGAALPITNDTYIDSFHYEATVNGELVVVDTQHVNYGHSGAVKAVSNNGSGSEYPLATSIVRGLFTLPGLFWQTADPAQGATVTFRIRNNSLNGRRVELYAMTHPFVAGTGGVPTATQGGTQNTPTNLVGADWLTYDGGTPWGAAGGDYDPGSFVLSTLRTVGTFVYLDLNLSPLLANPATRAEMEANGLMLRVTDEAVFTGNEFASLWSGDTLNAPTVTFSAVPEPGAMVPAVLAATVLGRRPSKGYKWTR